jgi:hypothetical protein
MNRKPTLETMVAAAVAVAAIATVVAIWNLLVWVPV